RFPANFRVYGKFPKRGRIRRKFLRRGCQEQTNFRGSPRYTQDTRFEIRGNPNMRLLGSDAWQNAGMPLRRWADAVARRKVKIGFSLFFLAASFFLSRAVLFEAAVPFLLPVWALAAIRYRQYLPLVIIGGGLGSLMLGPGQAAIHILQILLFHSIIRFRV